MLMLPFTKENLAEVVVVSIQYADGALRLHARHSDGRLYPINLSAGHPSDTLRHFATRYFTPGGTTQLVVRMLEAMTGQPFVLEPVIEGAPNERYIRQDLLSQVQTLDRQ